MARLMSTGLPFLFAVMMCTVGLALAIFVVAPLVGGLLLDALFGTWARWWRWWFAPLLVGIVLVGFLVWGEVSPGCADEPCPRNEIGPFVYVAWILFLAAVAAGAWVRRWVARSAAKRPI